MVHVKLTLAVNTQQLHGANHGMNDGYLVISEKQELGLGQSHSTRIKEKLLGMSWARFLSTFILASLFVFTHRTRRCCLESTTAAFGISGTASQRRTLVLDKPAAAISRAAFAGETNAQPSVPMTLLLLSFARKRSLLWTFESSLWAYERAVEGRGVC